MEDNAEVSKPLDLDLERIRADYACLLVELDLMREERDKACGERNFLRGILDALPDPVVAGRPVRDEAGRPVDGEVLFANAASTKATGHEPDEVVGRRNSEVFPAEFENGLFQDFVRTAATGEVVQREVLFDEGPGEPKWYGVKCAKLGDGWVATGWDIQARKEAEFALRRERGILESIVQNAPFGICFMTRDFVYEWVNPVILDMLGLPASQMVGKTAVEAFDEEATTGFLPLFKEVLASGQPQSFTNFPFTYPVGAERRTEFFDFTYQPVSVGGTCQGVVALVQDVSERLARERRDQENIETLERQKALLKGVLDSAIDAVLVWKLVRNESGLVMDATCILANPAASRIAHIEPDRFVGHRMSELFPTNFQNGMFEAYVRVVESGQPFESEYLHHGPPGPDRWLSIKAAKVEDGFAVTFADIHERKAIEQALQQERALRDSIIQHAPITISFLDRDQIYRVVNPTWTAKTGVPADQALGRQNFEVFPQAREVLSPVIERLLATGESQRVQALYIPMSVNGRVRDAYWDVEYLPIPGSNGGPTGILVMGHEVTHIVEREAQDKATIEALKRTDRLKDEFLSVVSHELRTPVQIVMGYLRILLKDQTEPLTAGQRLLVAKASAKTEDLAGIINAVLDFSQLKSGTLKLFLEDVDVSAYMNDLTGPLVDLAKSKALSLTTSIPTELPFARFDVLRIGQVVTNLVGNAIKFTAPGGIVHLAVEQRGEYLRLEVKDTGIGIELGQWERIFERFVQADMALTREADGMGLGLSIAQQLVEAHDGNIGVESEPGRGSTFWFEIPLAGRKVNNGG